LKSLDGAERVLYIGTFSKVMLPSLRLGYLVVPESQIDRFTRLTDLLHPGQAMIDQMALSDFMEAGHFYRHMKHVREVYKERRLALIDALSNHFQHWLTIASQPSGLHLVGYLPSNADDVALSKCAEAAGFAVHPLRPWYLGSHKKQGLLMSFANLPRTSASRQIARLARALASFAPRTS
jgi:GntR family transcriptional regulator/MocR family aminotransferase